MTAAQSAMFENMGKQSGGVNGGDITGAVVGIDVYKRQPLKRVKHIMQQLPAQKETSSVLNLQQRLKVKTL